MSGRTSYLHGRCSHCGGLYVLTTKGLMRRHYPLNGKLCPGSGQNPAAHPPGGTSRRPGRCL